MAAAKPRPATARLPAPGVAVGVEAASVAEPKTTEPIADVAAALALDMTEETAAPPAATATFAQISPETFVVSVSLLVIMFLLPKYYTEALGNWDLEHSKTKGKHTS